MDKYVDNLWIACGLGVDNEKNTHFLQKKQHKKQVFGWDFRTAH